MTARDLRDDSPLNVRISSLAEFLYSELWHDFVRPVVTKPPPELLEFLYRYDPAVQSLALGLRRVVLEEMAPCHEYIFAMRPKVVLLYGTTERVVKDCICSIGVFARHVTLAFHRGTDLDDAQGVLQGTGKTMRHIRLTKLSELDQPELRAFLRQARKRTGLRRPRQRTAGDVVTRVKQTSPDTFGRDIMPGRLRR